MKEYIKLSEKLEILKKQIEILQEDINLYLYKTKKDKIKSLLEHSCLYFGTTIDEIKERNRKPEICEVRNIIANYLRDNFKLSLKRIGLEIGNRDHSTVLNMLSNHQNDTDVYEDYRQKYKDYCEFIESRLNGN